MTKQELAAIVGKKTGLGDHQARRAVQMFLDEIIRALVEGKPVQLRGFGVFETRLRRARMARNPRTAEKELVPAKRVVTFKPGKELADRVRDAKVLPTVERDEP